MKLMNDFCEYCTAGDKTEIRKCKDRNCPFYRDRWSNLPYQDAKREWQDARRTKTRGFDEKIQGLQKAKRLNKISDR